MYNFCTLFNSNYLTRGLAMYESLKKHAGNFRLFIFAFDDLCCKLLKELNLESVEVISLKEFENEALLKVKPARSAAEYCWTCTPATIKYCIETFNLDNCTYVDADLYFYSDPAVLIEEMGQKSVLLTEHRYTPKYDCTKNSGIYCVQFMTFKNDQNGMKALNWWYEACLDWCYARVEDGKFGDQKYLDDWTERFAGVHVLQHKGGGVAPWNIQQFDVFAPDFNLVFYHFHDLKFLENEKIDLGRYKLRKEEIEKLYIPYLKHLDNVMRRMQKFETNYDFHGTTKTGKDLLTLYREFKRHFNGSYNIFRKSELLT
ncbi:MAG: glycosyl transferase [Candidatus Rifleibacteriota bacterium]